MATIFELGLPLTAVAFRQKTKFFRGALFTVSLAGFLLMASAAATTSLIIASIVVAMRQGMMSRVRWAIASLFIIFAVVLFSSEEAQTYFNDLIFAKALGFVGLAKEENMSAFDRSQRARIAIDLATDFPLGFGWGTGCTSRIDQQLPFEGCSIRIHQPLCGVPCRRWVDGSLSASTILRPTNATDGRD
jgi:hypothetical protein